MNRTEKARARVEFFVGTGGAGKTTLACAAALSYARSGRRVLLVAVDHGYTLARAFDCPMSATDGVVVVEPGLDVIDLDSLELSQKRFRELSVMTELVGSGPASLPAIDPAELTGLPGIQELLVLAEVRRLVERDAWDTVIVDYGRGIDPVRSLTMPETASSYLERIWPRAERVMAGNSRVSRRAVLAAVSEHVAADVDGVGRMLTDPRRCGAVLVTSAQRAPAVDVAAIRSALALYGLPLMTVVVNRVLPQPISGFRAALARVRPSGRPEDPAVRWYRQHRTEQLHVVSEVEAAVAPVPVQVVAHADVEPVGVAALYRLGFHPVSTTRVDAERDSSPTVELESGDGGLGSVYVLRLPLPSADPSSLRLGRVGDDIIVAVDGVRRRMRLASVLRRCAVIDAEFDGNVVIIRFHPDPEVWPA